MIPFTDQHRYFDYQGIVDFGIALMDCWESLSTAWEAIHWMEMYTYFSTNAIARFD
ncbi:MAG TPA: hypothetical protein PK006_13290 [Saprospiraceae bacterium]|nr:hypothetical protein [Saprospiraceae bacterium]